MSVSLKNKGIGFYLEAVAAILAIVTLVLGVNGKALTNNANIGIDVIIVVAIGVACAIAGFFVDFDFWTLLPAVCFFVAFGMIISGGAAVIVDKINNISFVGGDFTQVVTYLILLGVSSLLCIVACFFGRKRKTQE